MIAHEHVISDDASLIEGQRRRSASCGVRLTAPHIKVLDQRIERIAGCIYDADIVVARASATSGVGARLGSLIRNREHFDLIAATQAPAQDQKTSVNAVPEDEAAIGFVTAGGDRVGVDRIGAAQVDELRAANNRGARAADENPRLGSAGSDRDLVRIRQQ